jgi:hypothetical protein
MWVYSFYLGGPKGGKRGNEERGKSLPQVFFCPFPSPSLATPPLRPSSLFRALTMARGTNTPSALTDVLENNR